MRRCLLALVVLLFLFIPNSKAQSNQTVTNGAATTAANFPAGCTYNWVNNTPGIGLAASGTGNIGSFTAVNNGATQVIATITATPESSGFAYIANAGSSTVSVINTTTNAVVATIPVGSNPNAVYTDVNAKQVYVVNNSSGSVSVIDPSTNMVTTTIPVGPTPWSITVSPDGTRAYVAAGGSSAVLVINTATNAIIATIPVGSNPNCVAVSPDGSTLYVGDLNANNVYVVNTATNAVTATIPVGAAPQAVLATTDGSTVLEANFGSNTVDEISTATNTVTATITVGGEPGGASLSADGKLMYVANYSSNSVSVINIATNSVTATIPVGSSPWGLSVTPDGKEVYAANSGSNTVSVINASTDQITSTIAVGNSPFAFGSYFYNTTPCSAVTFTITVNPTSSSPPTITANTATGTISACAGSASISPQIQQFTVSGSNLTGNITATAPTNFEVSLNAGSGYGSSVSITQTGGTVTNTIVYVRSAESAVTGTLGGSVTLSSIGVANQTVAVTGTVNILPTVNAVANQTITNGQATTAINFTGTGSTFIWVNNTPGIGLAASGTGNILRFTGVNTGSSPITATITVTPVPLNYAYVANLGTNNVSVINTTTNAVISTIAVGDAPFGVSVSPDESTVYVSNLNSNTVSVIDIATNAVVSTINVGSSPGGIVVSPDGSRVYVANNISNTVSVINTATNLVIASIAVGNSPRGIAISSDGSKLYVGNDNAGSVSVINTATNQVVATIPVGINSVGICVSPDGGQVYVASAFSASVLVINTATNTVTTAIPVGQDPCGLCLSPDGSRLYVANQGSNSVSVINTATNKVLSTINVELGPYGVSTSPDGSRLYVDNNASATVSVINTADNSTIATIPVNTDADPFGNFVTAGSACDGDPVSFTITVNPDGAATPTITAGNTTGSIFACLGTASVSPNIQQFTVSGSDLTGDITVAPDNADFEVSLNPNSGYAASLTLAESAGTVSATTIYVRAAATGTSGGITASVVLTSAGATTVGAAVSGHVYEEAMVNPISPQTFINGAQTTAIDFTGTATNYNWVNDTPSIGLAASGSGNIAPFTATNPGSTPVTANITVTPVTSGGATGGNITCTGTPLTFTITVGLPTPPVITAAGELPPLVTTYGTPSASTIFTVSATALTAGILVTPPTGFEVSTDDVTFTSTVTIGASGTLATTQVYIRLAATTPVGDDAYGGSIALTSPTAPTVDLTMPASTVNPALLAVIADNKSKAYGAVNPVLTASYIGFVNNETAAVFTTLPVLSTTAITTSPVGQYPITVSGGEAPNYSITSYIPGILTVVPAEQDIFIPNTFTPNGDGINDTWNIKFLDFYSNCSVNIFNRWGQNIFTSIGYGTAWDGTYRGSPLPVGTYYYIINLKNGDKILSGFVAIVR